MEHSLIVLWCAFVCYLSYHLSVIKVERWITATLKHLIKGVSATWNKIFNFEMIHGESEPFQWGKTNLFIWLSILHHPVSLNYLLRYNCEDAVPPEMNWFATLTFFYQLIVLKRRKCIIGICEGWYWL